jgi:protease II
LYAHIHYLEVSFNGFNFNSFLGTNYFDDDWMGSGIAERKLTHFMDLIDSAIFLKEKGLTGKLGLMGMGESGSHTALTTIL